jgi:H+/Cl- antiporter ClcA
MLGGTALRRIGRVVAVVVVVLLAVTVSTAIALPASRRTIWSFVQDYRWWWSVAVVVAVAVLLVHWLLRVFLLHPAGSPWRAHVLASADAVRPPPWG